MSNARKSITFVPPAHKALVEEAEETGLSETDVVNRAVQVYRLLMERQRDGRRIMIEHEDGTSETVLII